MSYRVTVAPDGQVTTECDSPVETAALVRELQNGRAEPKKKLRELESEDVPLSNSLVDTWNWLVKHDTEKGLHANEIAAGLGIKRATANYRLNALIEKELARRTQRGHFRAGGIGEHDGDQ